MHLSQCWYAGIYFHSYFHFKLSFYNEIIQYFGSSEGSCERKFKKKFTFLRRILFQAVKNKLLRMKIGFLKYFFKSQFI